MLAVFTFIITKTNEFQIQRGNATKLVICTNHENGQAGKEENIVGPQILLPNLKLVQVLCV